MKKLLPILLLVLLTQTASTQMQIVVLPDRVSIGPDEFIPRLLDASRVLQVNAGQTVTLAANATWDYIEVAGTLLIPSGQSHISFSTITILPGGLLKADSTSQFDLSCYDKPLDRTRDPFQWTHGIINFGRVELSGTPKTTWTTSVNNIPAGATTVTVGDANGWSVGDVLLFPDMARGLRRESPVTITAINGNVITLSKGLDFEHNAVTKMNGDIVQRPWVANYTSSSVIRSEGAFQCHTANVGHAASWDVRYIEHRNLGRTKNDPLDGQNNRAGRYAAHNHHSHGNNSKYIGNVFKGNPNIKWALATHSTSNSLVAWNVGLDFPGGCFVTEDGPEFDNVFDSNFCAYSSSPVHRENNSAGNIANNCPGCEGAGFWHRGVKNTWTNNVSTNNEFGFILINVPAVPIPDQELAKPVLMRDTFTVANRGSGFEYWNQTGYWNERLVSAHNYINVHVFVSSGNQAQLKDCILIGNSNTTGIQSANAYISLLDVDGCYVGGHYAGITDGGGFTFRVKNSVFQNENNIELSNPGRLVEFENVTHLPYLDRPPRYYLYGRWAGEAPIFTGPWWADWSNQAYTGTVKQHQGIVGNDFSFFEGWQRRSHMMWNNLAPVSVCGNTQGESWDRCGFAYKGSVIADNEIVPFTGLINGLARQGLAKTPVNTISRAILTLPNRNFPPNPNDNPHLFFALTGTDVGKTLRAQINNDPPFDLSGSSVMPGDSLSTLTPNLPTGEHTVKSWRKDAANNIIPESLMTFTFCVPVACGGTIPDPPPVELCNPDGTGNGIDEDGDGLVDEICKPVTPPDTWDTINGLVQRLRGQNFIRICDPADNKCTQPIPVQ